MTIALRVGEAIDPVEGRLGPSILVLEGDRIAAVRPGLDAVPAGAQVIDHRDAVVLPGLIDAHVHLNLRADGVIQDTADEPDGALVATTVVNAGVALRAGITTLRDLGSKGTTVFDARAGAERAGAALPRLLAAGPPVTPTGGHCWFFGGEADGVEEVRRRVRERARDGADWIKVMGTGGGTPGSIPWEPSYTQPELDAVVDEAHRRGLKVTVHCLSSEGMRMAVEAGADHIEHAGFATDAHGGSRFDPAVADRLAEAGVVVTPTLSVRQFVRDHLAATGAPAELIDAWQIRFDNGMEQFRGLLRAGVRFAAGTDAGWHRTPFDGLAEEIALIAECGATAAEALRGATSATAEHFGLAGLGRLRPGSSADLLLVDADPLGDLRALRRVAGVVRAGRLV